MHAAGVNAGLSAGTFYSQGSANSTVGEHDLQLAEYQVPALASGTPAVCDALGGQVLPSRKILGKKGKVWYHKRYGIYRFKESREIRTQGDTQRILESCSEDFRSFWPTVLYSGRNLS